MVNFEKLALAKIIETENLSLFNLADFSNKSARFLYKLFNKYYDKFKKFPTKEVVESTIISQISPTKAPIYIGYFKGLPKTSDINLEEIREGLLENKAIKSLDTNIEKLVEAGENRDISEIKKLINEISVNLNDNEYKIEDAKDIEFNTDNIKSLDCFIPDVVSKLHGVVLVGAESGLGKSIFAMNQALHSYKDGADVLYMNLELAKNEQMARMLSCIYDLNFSEIYRDLSEEELKEFNKLKKDFFNKPNKFKMVNSTIDAEFIKNVIKTEAKTGLDLIVIDYLQIVKNMSNIERWKFLENFVQELHQISLDLGVVILTPVQINKSDVKEKKGKYHITPRGSKELEFSSSLFFFLTQNEEEAKDNIMRLITIKARQSKKHTYILEADLNHMKFKSTGLVI